ncbi:hypothetical protein C2845_PM01G47790 [Panicum miliaceum]|uniref:Uncharacterized protein n=1 Tax=Panicum miliaceum TaxID=4540 RepID=A0A3L6TFB8_PANMI|nr:hypothetical protein C2845_PM01G47790 [Panicum miliaceum]
MGGPQRYDNNRAENPKRSVAERDEGDLRQKLMREYDDHRGPEKVTKVIGEEGNSGQMKGKGPNSTGFYSIHIPTDKEEKKKEVLGIMIIEYGLVTADCIEKELRHLFKGISKWPIKKMDDKNHYMITFPSEAIRDQLSRFRGFGFETSIVKAKVIASEMSSGADGNLEEVWVKAYNFPPNAKSVEVIMEIAYLIGDPEEVDLTSLKKPGPMRIKVACRDDA